MRKDTSHIADNTQRYITPLLRVAIFKVTFTLIECVYWQTSRPLTKAVKSYFGLRQIEQT